MLLGAVFVLAALLLLCYNQWDARRAEVSAAQVMKQLEDILPDQSGETEAAEQAKTITIDGREYIGYLSIPAMELKLPVLAQWSDDGLKIAPARYSGSLPDGDLVIAGHNYKKHFSPIKWLDVGAEVDFVDAGDRVWHYQVSSVEELWPEQVDAMITETDGEEWDMTLFTCTPGGSARCAVRCVLDEN